MLCHLKQWTLLSVAVWMVWRKYWNFFFFKAIWLMDPWQPLSCAATEYSLFINSEAVLERIAFFIQRNNVVTLRILTVLPDVSKVIHSFLANKSLLWISEDICNIKETRFLFSISEVWIKCLSSYSEQCVCWAGGCIPAVVFLTRVMFHLKDSTFVSTE